MSLSVLPSRRYFPHLFVLLLLGLIGWGLLQREDSAIPAHSTSAASSAKVAPGQAIADPTYTTAVSHENCQHSQHQATIAQLVNTPARPNSPAVADVLERFRKSNRSLTVASVEELRERPLVGKQVTLHAAGIDWKGILDSRLDQAGVLHIGVTLNDELGRLQLSLREDQRMQAAIFFNGESQMLVANGFPVDGAWSLEPSTVDHLLCVPAGTVYTPPAKSQESANAEALKAPGSSGPATAGPIGAPPKLNSNPGSLYVIYCDFDGETVTHPGWNNGQTIVAAPHPRANDVDFVTRVWKRASEDFAAFDINVTTDRAVFDAAAVSNRAMCVCTPTDDAAPGAGGVAYLRSFGQDTPCWAFNGDEGSCSDTISHEIGHTLGLLHDGTTQGVEYYGGHGTGITSWAPIMGAYFANANAEEVTSWSKGEYPLANNKEDDLGIITSNGFGYRSDDKGNTQTTASFLKFVNGKVEDSGVIEKTDDLDWISFVTSGGSVLLNINANNVNSPEHSTRGSNMALSAELYDSEGRLVQLSNDPNELNATISMSINAGTYFIKLDGVARGTLANSFPEYASIGRYTITGTVPQDGLLSINPTSSSFTSKSGAGTFNVTSSNDWSWSCAESWVTSVESKSQNGNQKFDFSVEPNMLKTPRTAYIVLSVGGYTVSHVVNQEAVGSDDHSNFTNGATPVAPNSITDGKIEIDGDLDVFQIKVTQFGNLTVESSGATNTFGELLDYRGIVIASNDNALQPNFRITRAVSPGTFYVRVRHVLVRGIGAYKLVCRFNSTETLSLSPTSRSVSALPANYDFSVVCNTAWSWSSDVPWLTSAEAVNQVFGQAFTYTAAANTSSTSRTGHITLKAGALTATHTVVQSGAMNDDHGNTLALASTLPPTGTITGKIETQGDVDMFRVVLATSGTLKVCSTGTTDTYGHLYDAAGVEIFKNDDSIDDNFAITRAVNAGTYYVKVRHFSAQGSGPYGLNSTFTPSTYVNVSYSPSTGGTLTGVARQSVPLGGNATVVTAVPNKGYAFVKWSDGWTQVARNDRSLQSHLTVTAQFTLTLSVSISGGPALVENQFPRLDYGTRWINEVVPISFEIRNNGSVALTQLKVVKTGLNISEWTLSNLATTTLLPGQATVFTGTLRGVTAGYKSALFTVSVAGTTVPPFRIPVGANITNNIVIKAPSASSLAAPLAMTGSTPLNGLNSASTVASASTTPKHPAATPEVVIMIAADGLFHHHFRRAKGDATPPQFRISQNGLDWVNSDLLAVRKTGQQATWNDFEAILSPMGLNSPVIMVSEAPPMSSNP